MTQEVALKILKTGRNVFLTGEPGAGKTHTVNQYVRWLRGQGVDTAITASTGIAATHIGGMTIHSWSGIGIANTLTRGDLGRIAGTAYLIKRIRQTKVLIVDEVSMLGPQTLGMVDAVCREVHGDKRPFGGMQVVLVGDFFQLPPIVKQTTFSNQQTTIQETSLPRFAYDASVWERLAPTVCYLTEQHRQDDKIFLDILSAIRRNSFDEEHLVHVETRKIVAATAPKQAPKLFSHNADVDRVNANMLRVLPGQAKSFEMTSYGAPGLVASLRKSCLSPERLDLKIGAAVMFTKNNPKEGYVNGTLGVLKKFDSTSGHPVVETRGGRCITVEPTGWSVEENGRLRAQITQIPLRLAWAITVHKSQGMSLDEAVMDLRDVFEFGQGYVALSRVRRLSGLHLFGWNQRTFEVHPDVLVKDELFRAASEAVEGEFLSMVSEDIEKLHAAFTGTAGGEIKKKKEKGNTCTDTLLLWKQGKTVTEIAAARELTEGTILSHVEKLVSIGALRAEDLSSLLLLLTPGAQAVLSDIHAAFKQEETLSLSPVFEKFNGVYSYDDLRIARLLMPK